MKSLEAFKYFKKNLMILSAIHFCNKRFWFSLKNLVATQKRLYLDLHLKSKAEQHRRTLCNINLFKNYKHNFHKVTEFH